MWSWIGVFASLDPASATPPSLPFQTYEVRSASGICKAIVDIEKNQIRAYRLDPNGGKPIWTLDGYASAISISDDCLSLIASGGGDRLFLGNGKPSDDVLTIYREGRRIRHITLGEVYPALDVVSRSHPGEFWFMLLSWKGSDIVIHTVDGRTVTFSSVSGGKVE